MLLYHSVILLFSFLFFGGCRERPDFFQLRALPAADCDPELLLRSSVLSSELSRRSLAYPGPTEMNLAWSVRVAREIAEIELIDSQANAKRKNTKKQRRSGRRRPVLAH